MSESPTPPAAAIAASKRGASRWVPSLYFAEGIPYAVVMSMAGIMYKRLGISNRDITLFAGMLYLPWVIKPAWSMAVEGLGTRRRWVLVMQVLMAAGFAATALALNLGDYFRYTLAALWFIALMSATHDIAADGFYLLGLNSHQQAWYVGIRSTAYRLAMIVGQGVLVMLAGWLESTSGATPARATVEASDTAPAEWDWSWQELPAADGAQTDAMALTVSSAMSLQGRPQADAAAAIDRVRDWNVKHGFCEQPAEETPADQQDAPPGWVAQLENWIRTTFGPDQPPEKQATDRAGDLAIVVLRYPAEVTGESRQVVQFDRAGGDPSFTIAEGERFVVTADNWQTPFAAVVQVDAKLAAPSDATFEVRSGDVRFAWTSVFFVLAGLFVAAAAYHAAVMPRPAADAPQATSIASSSVWIEPLVSFFRKPGIVAMVAFLLLYRFAEAQLGAIARPFMLDARDAGGLGLTTGEVGFAYGTFGIVMLSLGGIVGGLVAARDGLKHWLWWMVVAINVPNLAYLLLSVAQPESRWVINLAVGVEQFGYGFGFTAYLLYCMYVARGEHQTVHYAMCTGLMALGMMIPGMASGWLQELIGYPRFFTWIMIATIPSFVAAWFIPLDANYGREDRTEPTP